MKLLLFFASLFCATGLIAQEFYQAKDLTSENLFTTNCEGSDEGKKTSNIAFGEKDEKTYFVTLQDRMCVETFQSETSGRNY